MSYPRSVEKARRRARRFNRASKVRLRKLLGRSVVFTGLRQSDVVRLSYRVLHSGRAADQGHFATTLKELQRVLKVLGPTQFEVERNGSQLHFTRVAPATPGQD